MKLLEHGVDLPNELSLLLAHVPLHGVIVLKSITHMFYFIYLGSSSPFSPIFRTLNLSLCLGENIIPLVFDFTGQGFVLNFRFILLSNTLPYKFTIDCSPDLLADIRNKSSAYP